MNKTTIFLLTLFCLGQFSCSRDFLNYNKAEKFYKNSNYKEAINYYDKALKLYSRPDRQPKNYCQIANCSYMIAECYRHENDTLYLNWYKNTIGLFDPCFKGDNGLTEKNNRMKKISFCYYYSKDYKSALKWFDRLIFKAKIFDSTILTAYIDCLKKTGKENEMQSFADKLLQLLIDENKEKENN